MTYEQKMKKAERLLEQARENLLSAKMYYGLALISTSKKQLTAEEERKFADILKKIEELKVGF